VDELPDPGGCCVLLGLGLWPGAQVDPTAGLTTVEEKKPTAGGESAECLEYLGSSRFDILQGLLGTDSACLGVKRELIPCQIGDSSQKNVWEELHL
jgi:hypothetical protein